MTLGLRRGEVRLVAHRPEWAEAFARERERLARALGPEALGIEHVGSTAVPGLAAKPVLDVAVAAASLETAAGWPARLRPEGYEYFGDREGWGEHFYARGPDECRTVYLHVVPQGSERWSDYLRFRDALRADAGLCEAYGTLKLRLAAAHGGDRGAYTEAKAGFIRRVLGREGPG